MRMIVALVLALGVALAGFAVFMAQDYMAGVQQQRDMLLAAQATAPQMMDVVVANRALKYGERFGPQDLEVVKVQAGKIPEGAYSAIMVPQGVPEAPRSVFFEGETRPRAALRSYAAFEVMTEAKITPPGVDAGILAALAPNKRAFTINVDVTSGVSGFLRPGDRVDVTWFGRSTDQDLSKLIDTNLRIIAVDQNADPDRTEETVIARTVTVEVSPEQVAALTLAQSTGRLTLSLVGNAGSEPTGTIEVDRNALLGIKEEVVQPVEAERVCTIRTRKGTDVIEMPIPCAN